MVSRDSGALPVGALDLHCHCGPSLWQRALDSHEAIAQATAARMAGVVLKDHHRATYIEARMLNEEARPGSARAIGSIVLNESQGGVSPAAVAVALELGARVVWMPTVSARHHQRFAASARAPIVLQKSRRLADGGPFSVLVGGRLKPRVDSVLRLIAETDAVLATGHLSTTETLAIVRRARDLGVRAVVATHPCLIVGATDADLIALVAAGALIEIPASVLLPESSLHSLEVADVRRWAELLGIRSLLLSSDLGQVGNPLPTIGLGRAVALLRRAGFTEDEVQWLIVEGPRHVIGSVLP
jgi:hypothetical protein